MTQQQITTYKARSYSSGTHGRAICNVRNHHFVADESEANGGPGDEVGAGELFLSGITACAVNMLERLARQAEIPLTWTDVTAEGSRDPQGAKEGPPVFDHIEIKFELTGPNESQGQELVDTWKRR